MSRFGLVGPSYSSQSSNLDAESCINWYPEADDGGAGNAPIALYPTPGTKVFANLSNAVVIQNVTLNNSSAVSSYVLFDPTVINTVTAVGSDINIGDTGMMMYFCQNFNGNGAITNISSVTDSKGNVWSALFPSQQIGGASGPYFFQVFYAKMLTKIPIGQNLVITGHVAIPGNTNAGLFPSFGNFTGLDVVDHTQQQTAMTATHPVSGAPVTTTQTEFLISFVLSVNGVNPLVGPAGWVTPNTAFGSQNRAPVNWAASWLALPQPPGVYSDSWSVNGGASGWGANFATFKLQAGAGVSTPIRGELTINGRTFVVAGPAFVELLANGTFTTWGTVSNDALPVTMAASPQQLLLASAGTAYVFDLMLNTLVAIPGATFAGPVAQAGICDDFFLLTIEDSKQFVVSAPLNALDWVTNGAAIVSVFPDNIVSMFVFQRQIWFFSDTQSVVYYDSGNIFPFDVNPNAFIEAGCAAENSVVQMNNSIFWLGSDARGHGKVWMANGYTPTRVSNHAIEFAIQGYSRIDDAVGLTIQDQGHEFYVLYFPTPSVTWVFDAATGMWHQRGYWVQSVGQFRAAHYQNHTFNFGKHLVGDWQSGNVYELHIPVALGSGWDFVTDAGNPIRRVRRVAHISEEQKWQFHQELQVFLESGLGPIPPLLDGAGKARDPQIMLRWSDDSAHSWSNEHFQNCGQAGQFAKRVRWLQLGRSRDRVYEISVSDGIPWRIIDGYLKVTPAGS